MSDISPEINEVQEPSYGNDWEVSVELHLKALDRKVLIALGMSLGGLALGAMANFLNKKLAEALGTIVQAIPQPNHLDNPPDEKIEQSSKYGRERYVIPVPNAEDMPLSIRPLTDQIIDESKIVPDGTIVAPANDGPITEASEIVKEALANDPLNLGKIIKDEGV